MKNCLISGHFGYVLGRFQRNVCIYIYVWRQNKINEETEAGKENDERVEGSAWAEEVPGTP